MIADVTAEFGEVSSAALSLGDRIDVTSSGSVVAHVDIADATQPLGPGTIDGDVTMKLAGGRAWGMDLTAADIDASLRDGLADIRTLEITGSAAKVSAKGPLALEGSGESALTYQAAISDLSAFDALAGRPMKGSVELEGTIKGPAQNTTDRRHLRRQQTRHRRGEGARGQGHVRRDRPRPRLRTRRGQGERRGVFHRSRRRRDHVHHHDNQLRRHAAGRRGPAGTATALLQVHRRARAAPRSSRGAHHEPDDDRRRDGMANARGAGSGRALLPDRARHQGPGARAQRRRGCGSTAPSARLARQRRRWSCAWNGCRSRTLRRCCSRRRN